MITTEAVGTTLRAKLFLFFFGVLFALVLLELLFRVGGAIFLFRQQQANRVSFDSNEVRILCIGESTTALGGVNSYPAFLERLLNDKSSSISYKVINRGMVSKNSYDIYDQLLRDLKQYRPHIVVGMIGVNDAAATLPVGGRPGPAEFFRRLRVVKFFGLLGQHLSRRLGTGEGVSPDLSSAVVEQHLPVTPQRGLSGLSDDLVVLRKLRQDVESDLSRTDLPQELSKELARRKELLDERMFVLLKEIGFLQTFNGHYQKALDIFDEALSLRVNDPLIIMEYIRSLRMLGRYTNALVLLDRMLGFAPDEPFFLLEMGKVLLGLGKVTDARNVFMRLVSLKISSEWIYLEIGAMLDEHGFYAEAEQALLQARQLNGWDHTTIILLAEVCEKQGKTAAAQVYRNEAVVQQKRMDQYLPVTVHNYNRIVDAVRASGARMVVMQYPVRRLEPLRAIFSADSGIVFVENRTSFISALAKEGFARYFSDNFAGDFGHCTAHGNRLIARNLAGILLDIELPGR
jgi:tetratricopeptide (TPR) repeat protein